MAARGSLRKQQSAPPVSPEEEVFPRGFGRYLLLREIGRGGMGIVYEAEDPVLERIVALKVAPLATAEDRKRFRNETRSLARLQHDNIIEVYETGDVDGCPYFTMPYMKGGSLGKRKSEYAGKPRHIAELLSCLARAAHHAHGEGIYHRDLKPANVLFDETDRPHIGDFGLAKDTLSEGVTRSGCIQGTAEYMAPEQVKGLKNCDMARTDVYGLGAMLFELLDHSPPHTGDSRHEIYEKVLSEVPRFRTASRRRRDLETICLRCLRKNPEKRYESAADLADDLGRFLRGEPIKARRIPLYERIWMFVRRHPAWAAVIVCAMVGLSEYLCWSVEREELLARTQEENRIRQDLLYASWMSQACQDVAAGKFDRAPGLMLSLSEFVNENDPRDFEFSHVAKRASQMITGLPGLAPPVRRLALSPDGFSSFLQDNELLRALNDEDIGHQYWERGASPTGFLALLPGKRVAAPVGIGEHVRVWDACTGELLESFDLPAPQTAGTYSRWGELYLGGIDGALHVCEPGEPPRRLMQAHDSAVLSIVFLGETDSFVSCGEDGKVLLWSRDSESFSELCVSEPILSLASFPDGNMLAGAGARGTVHVWQIRGSCGKPVCVKISEEALHGIAISSDGRLIATGGNDRCIYILRVTGGEGTDGPDVHRIRRLRGPNKEVLCLAFTHDAKRLISGAGDGGSQWDMTEIEEDQAHEEPLALKTGESPVTGVAFPPEEDRFYTAHEDLTLREWIVTGKSRKARVRLGRSETICGDPDVGVVLSPDARWAVTKTGSEELRISSVKKDCVPSLVGRFQTLGNAGPMRAVGFSVDGRVLATISLGDDLRTWRLDGDNWVFEKQWPRPGRTRRHSGTLELALSASGDFAAVSGDASGEIAIWRLDREEQPPALLYLDDQSILSLAFTPDQKFLIAGGTAARLEFLHLETLFSGKPFPYWQSRILRYHESAIVSIGFTRMGNPVSAGANGELIFWRYHMLEDGKIVGGPSADFKESASPIAALAFSPSNEFMVTGGGSPGPPELRLWRTFTPEEIVAYCFSR